MTRKYYVVRTDPDNLKWHWEELQAGRLHQGWGLEGMELQGAKDRKEVPESDWISSYINGSKQKWGVDVTEIEATKRYRILKPMVAMMSGDVILIPKMPSTDFFSLVTCDEGYIFDHSPIEQRNVGDDFRHTISVKDLKTFNYNSSVQARNVVKYWRAYQKAVNNVWSNDFICVMESLCSTPSDDQSKPTTDIFCSIKEDFLPKILDGINKLRWDDIEELVKKLFEKQGYVVVGERKFDRHGGDADLVLSAKLPLISEALDLSLNVYVQVKQKVGSDASDDKHVEQVDKIASLEPNCIKMVISTAEDFSDKAKELAKLKNVQLINGRMLAKMLIEQL